MCVSIANTGGAVVLGVPVRSHTFVELHALDVVREEGVEHIARLEQTAAKLIATRPATHKMTNLERGIDASILKVACERAGRGCLQILE